MKRSTLYITNGVIFLVSFLALYGLLLDASSTTRAIWELLYLVIGLTLMPAVGKSRNIVYTNAVFYGVNVLLVVLLGSRIGTDKLFYVLTIVLMTLGFLVSIMNLKKRNTSSYLSIDSVDVNDKEEVEIVDTVKPVRKKTKKVAKKTVKKKAKKKSKKKARK